MTASIPDIWAAFKQTLEGLDVQVYDYIPNSSVWPCVVIYPERWTFDTNEDMTWILWCLSPAGETQGAQGSLMSWLSDQGPDSIVAALDADSQLGGVISSVIPLEVRNWGFPLAGDGQARYLQAELVCNVIR